ncbi:SMP-30/gluconolactonase/LRE family protein [Leucobacter sp. G161]|uniref:SMP-30/gluconolactonase/LRE family protein n=1 Tax=Leucobacter sp. G161 TaxID=663704 RepID=UPI00073B9D00|nr:SMP-30/gluconolactonase/LRE family protein [Leucobacter sp. G161]KUF07740.1 gluconolactonase [Leucobacter sp. G161]
MSINGEFTTVVSDMSFTEGPRWRDGRLWFADFYTHAIYSVAEDGSGLRTEVEVPTQPSGLGWLPDGRLLYVSALDNLVMRQESDGTTVVHADLTEHSPAQLNDMIVDARGRCWIGQFGFDLMNGGDVELATLLRVDPDGTVVVVAEDLWFPNGMVVTGDGSTLLVNETFGNRVSAFDINADGELGPRRDWAVFGPLPTSRSVGEIMAQGPVAPDGCGLDADGNLWIADALGGRAIRVAEGGEILDTVLPGTGVFACMLGGADGRTLFLNCAPDFDKHARSVVREAQILSVRVDTPHGGQP